MEADMRCVLKRDEGCLFEDCRYWNKRDHICYLTNIDQSGWPSPDERLKETAMAKCDASGEEHLTAGKNRR